MVLTLPVRRGGDGAKGDAAELWKGGVGREDYPEGLPKRLFIQHLGLLRCTVFHFEKITRPGFEPGPREPKSLVLPLHYRVKGHMESSSVLIGIGQEKLKRECPSFLTALSKSWSQSLPMSSWIETLFHWLLAIVTRKESCSCGNKHRPGEGEKEGQHIFSCER